MDERKVTELFRDAASDAPPPSFGLDDIAAESARVRSRRRSGVLAGSAVGVVVLVGGAVAVNEVLGMRGENTAGVAAREGAASEHGSTTGRTMENYGLPGRSQGDDPGNSAPTVSPKQGGEESGRAGQRTGRTPRGCTQVDRELAVALAGELPATASEPGPGRLRCPEGARSAGFRVRVNGKLGTVSALVLPRAARNGQADPPWAGAAPHARHAQHPAARGGTVVVLSEPPVGGTSAPYATRLDDIAADLAGKF